MLHWAYFVIHFLPEGGDNWEYIFLFYIINYYYVLTFIGLIKLSHIWENNTKYLTIMGDSM